MALACRASSALALSSDSQSSVGCYLGQKRPDTPRSEQRNAFRSEPLLGDPYQLLERNFAGIAKEFDQTGGFSQACPARKAVNHSAATRPPVVR